MNRYLFLTVPLLLLNACSTVDLSSVQEFAKNTAAAKQSFDDLGSDWLGTCVRRNEYATAVGIPRGLILRPPVPPYSAGDKGPCVAEAATADQWVTRNDIVVNYVRALGAIANVGSVPSNTDELATSLTDVNIISTSDKAAFGDLASKIVSEVIANRQRVSIGQFAVANDASLRTALASLVFISKRYDDVLKDETVTLDAMYQTALKAKVDAEPSPPPPQTAFAANRLGYSSARAAWLAARNDIQDRHVKAAAYRDALAAIGKAHGEIVANASRFGPADLAWVINRYNTQFADDIAVMTRRGSTSPASAGSSKAKEEK